MQYCVFFLRLHKSTRFFSILLCATQSSKNKLFFIPVLFQKGCWIWQLSSTKTGRYKWFLFHFVNCLGFVSSVFPHIPNHTSITGLSIGIFKNSSELKPFLHKCRINKILKCFLHKCMCMFLNRRVWDSKDSN